MTLRFKIQKRQPDNYRKHRKRKIKFSKGTGRICRLILTRVEQNGDHTQIMPKILFRSSFKENIWFGLGLVH